MVRAKGEGAATLVAEGGRIAAVRPWDDAPRDAELVDFGDRLLLPGLVDTHVHINEPGRTEWEGFWTATRAAAAGGVTTLVDMPLNCIPETTSVAALGAKREAAVGKAWVDWATVRLDGGVMREVRLGAASLAPFPTRLCATEAALEGKPTTTETTSAARRVLLDEARPIDDIRSTAEYRKRVAANLLEEFLTELARGGEAE